MKKLSDYLRAREYLSFHCEFVLCSLFSCIFVANSTAKSGKGFQKRFLEKFLTQHQHDFFSGHDIHGEFPYLLLHLRDYSLVVMLPVSSMGE